MSHFLIETLPLFGFGFSGVLIMAFIKMNDINNRNESYTFKIVFHKFMSREWPSYGLSILVVLIASLTHDEWLKWFTTGKLKDIIEVPVGVKIAMILFGIVGQYFIYKKFGKLAKPLADNNTQQ